MRLSRFALAPLTAAVFALLVQAPAPLRAQAGTNDAARLRTLFFQRDYESALIAADRMTSAPAAQRPEIDAWRILNLVRRGQETDAVAAARTMVGAAPQNGWSWLALAGALNYQGEKIDEAIAAGDKVLQLMPGHPDAVWIHALTLSSEEKRRDDAIKFVDAQRGGLKNPAQLLVVKAYALYSQSSGQTRDEVKEKAAFETFAEARRIDPNNLDALYMPATYLTSLRRADEAIPLLKTALTLAPASTAVHQNYWRTVNASSTMKADAKTAAITADLDAFVAKEGTRSGALYSASSMLGDLKLKDRQRALEDTILTKFSDSLDAEWVLTYRLRDLVDKKDGTKDPSYRKMLTEYVARPRHYHMGLLGEAYRNLFFVLVEDPAITLAEIKPIFDGMVKYETTNVHITHGGALVSLADHKLLLADAERVARLAPDVLKKKVESQRDAYDTPGDFARSLDYAASTAYDALGWVLLAEGRTAEAETALLKAYDSNHESRGTLYHLGKLYEGKNDLARADEFYIKGLGVQGMGENPSETALKALYAKSHASADGFDAYLADLKERDRVRRRDKILGERDAAPEATPAFNLKTLDGQRVSFESLKGKVAVINFWGIWCGWCVHELPDYQKLYEKYKGDSKVVILTIDNDQNPNDVPPWMKEKAFTFPVLLDDGFVSKANITAFPTTWFLDREGRRAFVKVGWSEKLLEEFSWRIDAIK